MTPEFFRLYAGTVAALILVALASDYGWRWIAGRWIAWRAGAADRRERRRLANVVAFRRGR